MLDRWMHVCVFALSAVCIFEASGLDVTKKEKALTNVTPTTWAGLSNCQQTDRRICRQTGRREDWRQDRGAGGQGRAPVLTKSIN